MALHTLDPDAFTEEERTALRKQVKKLLALAGRPSEDVSATGQPPEKSAEPASLSEAGFSKEDLSEENSRPSPSTEEEKPASHLNVRVGGQEVSVTLPQSLAAAFLEVLTEVAQGHSVSVGFEEEELTTSEAAELLGVSRPHLVKLLLVKLLEEGEIPFRKVGTHRRVRREDVLEYKQRQRKEAEEAMQNLADQAQELGLGY
jgi:excisionase family DNA binding protein